MTIAIPLARVPDLAAWHFGAPDVWPWWLHSSSRGGRLARWSVLLHPAANSRPLIAQPGGAADFFAALDQHWQAEQRPCSDAFPFAGGWFIFLGYEAAGWIEPRLVLPESTDGLPCAFAQRCDAAVVVDHQLGAAWLLCESGATGQDLKALLESEAPGASQLPDWPAIDVRAEPGERFMQGVERIREYIRAGDVFQVNLSRGWQVDADGEIGPAALYRRLVAANPAPFAGSMRLPGGWLLSSSPERLVAVRDGRVETRPIAGTRPRGVDRNADTALSAELLAHPKERAEHIMLIDLERNDLGRVCVTGSVRVDELMVLESYAHVHHIVSNVSGTLRPGVTPGEVIKAVFPGGTITGCPKVRCMEIIAELEAQGRGFYTGSAGYLGLDGRLDLNILIRSMLVRERQILFRTGAGIVADSEPVSELAETEAKARGLLNALEHRAG
ncbi:MAG: aminodeoxychorismate synthase component I [Wenzhouxiangellaceae bacterium]